MAGLKRQRIADGIRLAMNLNVDIGNHRDLRRCNGRLRQTRGELLSRRLEQARMEGRRHRKRNRAAAALGLRQLHGLFERGLFARDHDLSRRVVVHGFDDARTRRGRFAADGLDVFVSEADDRRHAAHADRHGALHRLRAEAHELHAFGKRKGACAAERGVLAERVAGHHFGLRAACGDPGLIERRAREEERRLGVDREAEIGGRAFGDERRNRRAERLVGRADGRFNGRIAGKAVEHADRLAPLAGENKCDAHGAVLYVTK